MVDIQISNNGRYLTDQEASEYIYEMLDEWEEIQKVLPPIREVCDKYNIKLEDLPEVLEEYIAYDNDDQW